MRPKHLQTQNQFKKEIAHQQANNNSHPPHPKRKGAGNRHLLDARCSQPLSTNQTPHPTTKDGRQPTDPTTVRPPPKGHGPVVSKPNSVSDDPRRRHPRQPPLFAVAPNPTHYRSGIPHGSHPHQLRMSLVVLLRKEVIQPHLPVRLPCYDFVPIADPTFDGSSHGLGHRLRVLPTFMT